MCGVQLVPGEFSPELHSSLIQDSITNLNSLNYIQENDQLDSDELEAQVLAASANRRHLVISLNDVKTAAISDKSYADLLHAVQHHNEEWPEQLQEYKRHRKDLSSVEGIVLFKGRIVVPEVLRAQTLESLHLAHQGESGMILRTQQSVWWPNITADITNK